MQPSRIAKYMVASPYCVEPTMNLKSAEVLMRSRKIRHLPVIKNDRLLGIVSERELKAARCLPQGDSLKIGDIMTTDVFVSSVNSSLADVARKMAEHKFGSTLIVNNKNEVIGIFTTTDALRILGDFMDTETLGHFIDENDYQSWSSASTAFEIRTEE